MRSKRALALIVLFAAVRATELSAQAANGDAAAVIATVQRLFDGFAKHDTVALRRVLNPGTTSTALPVDGPNLAPRTSSDTAMIRSLGTTPDHLVERMWNPVVKVDGSIATLWAPYDFHRNGTFSHCGIDTMTLMRLGGEWRIVALAYTVQRDKCAPSPLGVLKP